VADLKTAKNDKGEKPNSPDSSVSGNLDKLKELEATLARELDQQVRLTEASDVRLNGSIALNPTLELTPREKPKQPEPPPDEPAVQELTPVQRQEKIEIPPVGQVSFASNDKAPQKNENDEDQISLQDVDSLLEDLDEGFQASIDQIKNELGPMTVDVAGFESIAISKDYLNEGKKEEEIAADSEGSEDNNILAEDIIDEILVEGAPKGRYFGQAIRDYLKTTALLPIKISRELVRQFLLLKSEKPKDVLLEIPSVILPALKEWLKASQDFFKILVSTISEIELLTYAKVLLLLLLAGGFTYVSRDIIKNFSADKAIDPYLKSFREISKDEVLIPLEEEANGENPFRQPQFVVSLARMIANLKVIPRHTPMLSIELYVEASNQDVAIEIHERELEIKDLVARITEQTTFDEMDTKTGKEQFKSHVITALNHILNKGRAKKIFFKNLQIKK
jgi:flagellar basal body-associated protein FliL